MKTRISTPTLLAALLLCAPLGAFAQTKPATTPPVVSTPPVATAPSVNVGQSVTISSTSYVVSAKKQLATGVEYYTMKPLTTKAKGATFLRTNGAYNATVFTQAQYEAFMNTGKMSSFGSLSEVTVKGTSRKYTTKGTTTAVLGVVGSDLVVYEFLGPVTMLSEKQDDPTACDAACQHGKCISGCLGEVLDCILGGKSDCGAVGERCRVGCGSGPAKLPMASVHRFKGTKPILKM